MNPSDMTPVIIGIGEICDRPTQTSDARDPLSLMRDVAQIALQDCGTNGDAAFDSVDIINPASWAYDDLPGQLCKALSITPARAVLQPTGGETPLKAVHAAADRIAAGESTLALVVGAEAQHSVRAAMRIGQTLRWPPKVAGTPDYMAVAQFLEPRALQLGLFFPSHVYPFYDLACAHHWGQTPEEAIDESAALWEHYAKVAKTNPYSWKTDDWSADDIKTPTPKNRLIAWPYTKAQVANPTVNQASAVIITSLSKARAMGVDDAKIVYITGGAFADEPRNFMARENYYESPAQTAVLQAVKGDFDAVELYSCFPVVPKMAKRILGLSDSLPPSVTGGLSFFGAPLNNYMTHSTCAMVRAIRGGKQTGLLYGQGEFVTKHYALTLSRSPSNFVRVKDSDQSNTANAARGDIPAFDADATGPAKIETFTIPYDRSGKAEHGILVVRTDAGTRSLAKVILGNGVKLAWLTDPQTSPIGTRGTLARGTDGVPLFTPT
ncbi:acetyl-CoA acetyltransferase [Fretibacter rubidus]|uniref:acetyl-CoA acetyltransferase n=1 Tax=Fretibacter rubidus TaxID=570162 RepID=UPI00352A811A